MDKLAQLIAEHPTKRWRAHTGFVTPVMLRAVFEEAKTRDIITVAEVQEMPDFIGTLFLARTTCYWLEQMGLLRERSACSGKFSLVKTQE